MENNIIDAIETKLGYEFKDKALLIQAFTRESYAKEQRVKGVDCQSNEQLEYFGDSVLNYLVVCGQLDHFTKVMEGTGLHVLYKEGKLSEFNSHWTDKTMLSDCIDALGFAQYLIMSKGDVNQKAYENKSVKEDLFESLVGAMWIDSDKDISRIQNVVYSMLNITFEIANVEKNYVSQLIEYADKHKYSLKRELIEGEESFKVIYTITLDALPKEDREWDGIGYGKNIKQAESNAAFDLITTLEKYGWYNVKVIPKIKYNLPNSINVLQELNQKGYIGEVLYEDEACFTTERKPYWRVTCKINNYITSFVGTSESKKEAKKNAAFDALVFIYQHVNQSTGYDPANKDFRLLFDLNEENPELKVFVIDSFEDFVYKGYIFPDNKEMQFFAENETYALDGKWIKTYKNPKEAFVEWMKYADLGYGGEALEAEINMFIDDEYDKIPEEVKNNGVSLLTTLIELKKKFMDNYNK